MDNNVKRFKLSSAVSNLQEKVYDFWKNVTQISHDDFIETEFFEQFKNTVIDYELYLEDSSDWAKHTLE